MMMMMTVMSRSWWFTRDEKCMTFFFWGNSVIVLKLKSFKWWWRVNFRVLQNDHYFNQTSCHIYTNFSKGYWMQCWKKRILFASGGFPALDWLVLRFELRVQHKPPKALQGECVSNAHKPNHAKSDTTKALTRHLSSLSTFGFAVSEVYHAKLGVNLLLLLLQPTPPALIYWLYAGKSKGSIGPEVCKFPYLTLIESSTRAGRRVSLAEVRPSRLCLLQRRHSSSALLSRHMFHFPCINLT